METETLRECPFCGGAAARGQVTVECMGCGASTGAGRPNAIVAAWNRRASGWVPVSERLPPDGEPVLLGVAGRDAYWTGTRGGDEWIGTDENGYTFVHGYAFTHWRPRLGAPPSLAVPGDTDG